MDTFRHKHITNDLSVFGDFRELVVELMDDNDTDLLLAFWNAFPDATWTRACGFMMEDLVLYRKKYKLAKMFWDRDMFRMGGRHRAEDLKHYFLDEETPITSS